VDNAHAVAVSYGVHDGSNSVGGLLFRVMLFFDDSIEELNNKYYYGVNIYLSTGHEFEHQVQTVAFVEYLEELDHVGMIELREDVDL
jgi:hypothetical protein